MGAGGSRRFWDRPVAGEATAAGSVPETLIARPVPRDLPPDADEAVTVPTLSLPAYEAGRPDAALACRIGDERFMPPAARSAAGA